MVPTPYDQLTCAPGAHAAVHLYSVQYLDALHADRDAQHADERQRDEQVEDGHQQDDGHQKPEGVGAPAAGRLGRLRGHHRLHTGRHTQHDTTL